MDLGRYRSLPPRERALVALAVLLDGHEAAGYLEQDSNRREALASAAADLAAHAPELRMPLVGSMLRRALEELQGEARKVR